MQLYWPLVGPIVQGFNSTVTGELHHGIDIAADPGTPVVSPVDGVVTFADLDDSGQNGGGTVRIRGEDGRDYVLVHVDAAVGSGRPVAAGQLVATVATPGTPAGGNAHQPHLHFQVEAGRGIYVDPTSLMAAASQPAAAATSSWLFPALVGLALLWVLS